VDLAHRLRMSRQPLRLSTDTPRQRYGVCYWQTFGLPEQFPEAHCELRAHSDPAVLLRHVFGLPPQLPDAHCASRLHSVPNVFSRHVFGLPPQLPDAH
jgi:hypothetical protein